MQSAVNPNRDRELVMIFTTFLQRSWNALETFYPVWKMTMKRLWGIKTKIFTISKMLATYPADFCGLPELSFQSHTNSCSRIPNMTFQLLCQCLCCSHAKNQPRMCVPHDTSATFCYPIWWLNANHVVWWCQLNKPYRDSDSQNQHREEYIQ